jgi:hypothetical protein
MVQLGLEVPVGGVGVDHVDQVTAGAGQVGGIQAPGLLEQDPFATDPQRLAHAQLVDRLHDDVGLLGRDPPGGHGVPRRRERSGHGVGPGHDPAALTLAEPAHMGQPVRSTRS